MIKNVMRESNYETGKAPEVNKLSARYKISFGVSNIASLGTQIGVTGIVSSPGFALCQVLEQEPDEEVPAAREVYNKWNELPETSQILTSSLLVPAFGISVAAHETNHWMVSAVNQVKEGCQDLKQASARDRLKKRGINPKLTEMANSKKERKIVKTYNTIGGGWGGSGG